MRIQLIQVPYDSGRRGERMGRGPLHFIEQKADDMLRANGWQIDAETVESEQSFNSEISTAFELARQLAARVQAARDMGAFPIVLAGNCISCLGTISSSYPEELGVIWFDAHGDLNIPNTTASGFLDGMALSTVLARTWRSLTPTIPGFVAIPEEQVILVGTRQLDPPEELFLAHSLVTVVNAAQIHQQGIVSALPPELVQLRTEVGRVYIHFDMDVLDPAKVGQANQYGEPDGLTIEQVEEAFSLISQHFEIVSIAFTAYDPNYDRDDRILQAGVRLMQHVCRLVDSASDNNR